MNRGKIIIFALFVILIFSVEPVSRLASKTFEETAPGDKSTSRDYKIPDTNPELNSEANGASGNPEQSLVVIDAGHGGIDPGCEGNKLLEKDISLSVAVLVEKKLAEKKIPIYMIRKDDTTVNVKTRIRTGNEKQAALYVAIHCDWFKDPTNNGTTVLYYPSTRLKAGNLTEKQYAQIMDRELETLDTNSRGVAARRDLAVLSMAKMPSVIIELGFLSSSRDAGLLSSESFREKAAEAIANGISKALDSVGN